MQEVDSTADKQIFPFFMMNEQKLYAEISKMLADLYKSPSTDETWSAKITWSMVNTI